MAIDVVTEEIADNLEEIAQATRRINASSVGIFLGGAAVGLVVGVYFGRKWNREKLKAEAFKQSEEEVEKIRELYQAKTVAATPKPSVEEIVEEKGYDRPDLDVVVVERPLRAPVPGVIEPTPLVKPKEDEFDFARELQRRTETDTYVIHQDERGEKEGYQSVVYTYYAGDDVLVDDENGHPLPHADIVVGVDNLQFGYGTDDNDVVFVRNERLELEMEICRVPDSYEEKILGLENSDLPDEEDGD